MLVWVKMESIALIEKDPPENSNSVEIKLLEADSISSKDSVFVQKCYPGLLYFQNVLSLLGIIVIFVIMSVLLSRMLTATPRE